MASQAFELAILISLKDMASGRADNVTAKLRELGKEGRGTLKTFDDLRRDLRQGLVMGGVGIAGLMALRGGIKSAGDFEAAMADLRLSIEETGKDGKLNLAKLGDEMNRFEKLGMDLGNVLPGTTQDFIEMFSTLKQGGLSTETILAGTGQAVAHLAVVTGQVPKALAEPFAQYVQQFHLTGEEATKLSNVLAKLKFTTGLNPQELIEGSKFFQLRAGSVLGMKGLEGAEQSGRLLATLRRSGLEGGIGGRELAGMFAEMTFRRKEQQKLLAQLRGQGINLQFFDKQGKFAGIENAFAQMEKLRGLSTKMKLEVLDKLFSREAAGPANIMIEAGVEGWKKTNAEIDRSSSLQDKINEKVGTYNAKLEAVLGTMENLKATTFTPILETLKPLLDTANSITGALQGWAKEHQTIAGFATRLFGMGSAAIVVVGGFSAMRTAWNLWKLASAVGSGQFLAQLRATEIQAKATSTTMNTAAVSATGYRAKLGSIMPFVKTTVILYGIEYALDRISAIRTEYQKLQEALGEERGATKSGYQSYQKLAEELRGKGKTMPQAIINTEAATALASLNKEREVEKTFAKEKFGVAENAWRILPVPQWMGGASKPYGNAFGDFSITTAAKSMKEKAPQLGDPAIAKVFLEKLRGGAYGLQPDSLKKFEQALQYAFPESMMKAQRAIADETLEREKVTAAQKSSSESLTNEFTPSVINAAKALRGIGVSSGPSLDLPLGGPSLRVPSRAMGGDVQTEGLVHLHSGERILPARVTRGLKSGAAGAVTITGGITINVPKGSRAADDPEAFAQYVLSYVTHEVHLMRERR